MLRLHCGKESEKVEETNEFNGSSLEECPDGSPHQPVIVPSSSLSPSPSSSEDTEDKEDDQSAENPSNQLVLYDPKISVTGETDPVSAPSKRPSNSRFCSLSNVLPSIGAFTVQCAKCFKWRLIPTKEKYEEIREHILEKPFFCETAREWRPDISCDDPTDISQDSSRLWAIDKPNIAKPPPGWQRLLRIRGEGSTRFADVYYVAPSGKKLRSMVEIQKYLMDHPEYLRDGLTISQFSFQIPKPLQENYVRRRPPKLTASRDSARTPEPTEASPLSWVSPGDTTKLKLGRPTLEPPFLAEPDLDLSDERPKKKARQTPSDDGDPAFDLPVRVEKSGLSRNDSHDL